MKLFKIALSNIRRRKSGAFTFFMMTLLCSFMLAIAITLFLGIQSFYDDKHDELKGSHYTTIAMERSSGKAISKKVRNSSLVKQYMEADSYMLEADIKEVDKEDAKSIILKATDFENSSITPLKLIAAAKSIPERAIVVPLSYRTNGMEVGDTLHFDDKGKKFNFKIYAFFEDIETGASTVSLERFYVYPKEFKKLGGHSSFLKSDYMTTQLKDVDKLPAFTQDFEGYSDVTNVSYPMSKAASGMFINIISLILLLFALLILAIALVIVRFNIVTSLQEDIGTIGALKSVGYTSNQLIGSQLVQYGMIAMAGGLVGVLLSLLSFGFLGNVIAGTSGLLWMEEANWTALIIAFAGLLILCIGLTAWFTQRTRKITPIKALRQGDSHHSFRRNVAPLDYLQKMPLQFHLALKTLLRNWKSNISLVIVITILSMACSLVGVINYNTVNPKAFHEMVGLEDVDYLGFVAQENPEKVIDKMKGRPEVGYTVPFLNSNFTIEGVTTNGMVYKDYSKSTAKDLYKGRKPSAKNEITLGVSIAEEIEKEIGDTVSVKTFGKTRDYIVVGLIQGLSNGGRAAGITLEGAHRHDKGAEVNALAFRLSEGADKQVFEKWAKDTYGSGVVLNYIPTMLDSIFGSMESGIFMASYVMMIASVFTIAFVLFLLINALIRKEKSSFGIYKSCGYTSRQIIVQVLMAYLPSLLLGCVAGAFISIAFTNDLLSVMFKAGGLNRTMFVTPYWQNIWICTGLFVISIVVVLLLSIRIRKISAHRLIVGD